MNVSATAKCLARVPRLLGRHFRAKTFVVVRNHLNGSALWSFNFCVFCVGDQTGATESSVETKQTAAAGKLQKDQAGGGGGGAC